MTLSNDHNYIQLDRQRVENAIKSDNHQLLRSILETSPYTKQLLKVKNSRSRFLDEAINMSNEKTVRVLLELGVELDSHYYPALFWKDNLQMFKLFIEFQFDVFAQMDHQSIINIICNHNHDECVLDATKIFDFYDLGKLINGSSSYVALSLCCYYDSINIFNEYFAECGLDHKYHVLFWSVLSAQHNLKSRILTYVLEKWPYDEHIVRETLTISLKCKVYSCNIDILIEYLQGIDPDANIIKTFINRLEPKHIGTCLEHNRYDSLVQSELLQLLIKVMHPIEECNVDEERTLDILKLFIKHNFDLTEIFDELLIIAYACDYQSVLKLLRESNVDKSLILERILNKFQKVFI